MKTPFDDPGLSHVLDDLRIKKRLNFNEICDLLFTFSYSDFDSVFHLSERKVSEEIFIRIPVFEDDPFAVLTVWGSDSCTAIHDHGNYDGRIKILKGSLGVVNYRENSNFIEFNSLSVGGEGDIFTEELAGIHSIINNEDDISVSLHLYRSDQLNLEGVRIFDTEHRKIAYLSHEAKSCAWGLEAEAYTKIIQV
ncbi:MAG TPA: hypothetical protein DCL65_09445 [Chryseobacterium sp.]|mgnify:CR=1 FL=1|nr:cysteine dioxygenase family protein [Kaistella sp.]HAI81239.1 hypothetical protein [Chryseobacterium sp.]